MAARRLSRLRRERRRALGARAGRRCVPLVRPRREVRRALVPRGPQPRQRRRGTARRAAALRRRDPHTPFDSLVAVAERHYRVLPVRWLLRHRFDSLSIAPRIAAALLCLVATQDEVIPPEHARRLHDAWGGPK